MAGPQRLKNFGMGKMHAARIARCRIRIEDKDIAAFQFDSAILEQADAQLWSLQIEQDRDRAPNSCSSERMASTRSRMSSWLA